MPTIFEYMGIILKFFSKEHLPIHVHAYYGKDYGMRVEFTLRGNEIVKKDYSVLKGYKHFPPAQSKDLKDLINKYEKEITKDWVNFAVKYMKIKKKTIRTKIK